jgi:hypothetical protein
MKRRMSKLQLRIPEMSVPPASRVFAILLQWAAEKVG